MTTRRDALMHRNKDINKKDLLLREGQQEPEDSLEYETKTLPLTLPLNSRDEISCSGGDS